MKSIIAKNINDIIAKQNLNQEILAVKAGYLKDDFANMLNGNRDITASDIPKIVKVLNITPNDLFKK